MKPLCAKFGCGEPVKHSVLVMAGVKIHVCQKHLEWAKDVAFTGRS